MSEGSKHPFFFNSKRLQRDESYFEIGRDQEKLRKFTEQKRHIAASRSSETIPENGNDEHGLVGYYGVDRCLGEMNTAENDKKGKFDSIDFEETGGQGEGESQNLWEMLKIIGNTLKVYFSEPRLPHTITDVERESLRKSRRARIQQKAEVNMKEDLRLSSEILGPAPTAPGEISVSGGN